MLRRFVNWLNRPVGRRPRSRRRRARSAGCLLWLLILIGVLVILSLFFGSFQKATRAGGPAPPPALAAVGPAPAPVL
jgi:cell division septal protein FtsQ